MKNKNDLTIGSIPKKLLFFTLPLLISVVCQQLYNLTDSIIAGKFLGESSFAAISNSYEITLILLAVSVGSNIGCSVVFSQLFGAKKFTEMKSAISTTIISTVALSLFLTVFSIIFLPSILLMINTPSEILEECTVYLTVYVLGFGFMFLYNIANGAFSSMGDSLTPLFFLVGSSVLNIILDLILVGMGIAGLALATLISQAIACIVSLMCLLIKLKRIKTDKITFFSIPLFKKVASISIPSIFQQGVVSVGNVILQGLINSFGTAVIAGYGAGVKLSAFAVNTYTTLGNGISAFTAQNIGALKYERVIKGLSTGLRIAFVLCAIFALPYFFSPEPIITLFISNPTEEAVRVGVTYLRIVSPFYFMISVKLVCDGVLRGAGDMKRFLFATFTDLLVRIVFAFILSKFFADNGIWMAWPIGWAFGTALSIYFYKKGTWKRIKI